MFLDIFIIMWHGSYVWRLRGGFWTSSDLVYSEPAVLIKALVDTNGQMVSFSGSYKCICEQWEILLVFIQKYFVSDSGGFFESVKVSLHLNSIHTQRSHTAQSKFKLRLCGGVSDGVCLEIVEPHDRLKKRGGTVSPSFVDCCCILMQSASLLWISSI